MTSAPLAALAQTQHPTQTASAFYLQPPLDGLALGMAYNRMNGTTPDFRPAAERSGAYLNATTFDRPAVLTREIARLEGAFRTFDLDRVYSMRIGVNVEQYDAGRQGYPVNFGAGSGIQMTDPTNFHGYDLTFRNADDVDFLAVGDATAARNFSQANGFDTQNAIAGQATLQLAFRLADAPPTLDGSPDTVRADILAARVLSQNGTVLHDFGSLVLQGATAAHGADGAPAIPELKTADVQGFHVGMSAAEAEALGSRGWTTKLGPDGLRIIAFFNGLQPAAPIWARCGGMEYGSPDPSAVYAGTASLPPFKDCMGVRLDGNATAGSTHTVEVLVSQQHLGEADAGKLLTELKAKYGPPVYVRNSGTNLVWLGRDPARLDGSPLEVTADVRDDPLQVGRHESVLSVTIEPYVDPRPKPAAQAATSAAAKL